MTDQLRDLYHDEWMIDGNKIATSPNLSLDMWIERWDEVDMHSTDPHKIDLQVTRVS